MTPSWHPDRFKEQKPYLKQRMELVRAVRSFFDEQDFWEVETPILQAMPGADVHIHGFKLENGPKGSEYLQNSPEFAMKKLLVAGAPKIYQICRAFRREEHTKLHNPEFTILEWYRANAGYEQVMDDCEGLLRHCARVLCISEYKHASAAADPFGKWQRISVCEAFQELADIHLEACLGDTKIFAKAAVEQGVRVADGDTWDDVFHAVMAEKIEPHLGIGVPTILYDYPASMASLSRKKPCDPRFAERFELYVCGVELANAFGELTDVKEQRARFVADMAEKQRLYGENYPLDEDFLAALECGLPESSGIALGIDRLAMLSSGAGNITQVLWA